MQQERNLYYPYSEYLKKKYGEKVYKLPVNLPVSCPNRQGGREGCAFCSPLGTGFEAADSSVSVSGQLALDRERIERRYHAHKFIAYFQNYTNTFLPLQQFSAYMKEAAETADIVELAVSTRPDCIREDYLDVLKDLHQKKDVEITVELGLQTPNYHTLAAVGRGHTLAEFIDGVLRVRRYGFDVCAHVILNLPGDDLSDAVECAKILSALGVQVVKAHSLYIARGTRLCKAYENGTIALCDKEEYLERAAAFLDHLDPSIAVERLFARAPEDDVVFCNWGTSWWKLRDELEEKMGLGGHFQGRCFSYLDGAALES